MTKKEQVAFLSSLKSLKKHRYNIDGENAFPFFTLHSFFLDFLKFDNLFRNFFRVSAKHLSELFDFDYSSQYACLVINFAVISFALGKKKN
jgi:hypothetical protein